MKVLHQELIEPELNKPLSSYIVYGEKSEGGGGASAWLTLCRLTDTNYKPCLLSSLLAACTTRTNDGAT